MRWCRHWNCAPVNIRCVGRPLGAMLLMQSVARSERKLPSGEVGVSGVRVRPPRMVKRPLGFLCSLALPCSHRQVKPGFRICSDVGHATSPAPILPCCPTCPNYPREMSWQLDVIRNELEAMLAELGLGQITTQWDISLFPMPERESDYINSGAQRVNFRMPPLLLPSCLSPDPSVF